MYVAGMEYVYGASEYFGANRKEGVAGMSFSINGIQGVFCRDDKGNYFVIGLNVKAKYKNDNNEVIVHEKEEVKMIFRKKQLYITYDLNKLEKVRSILAKNDIDYKLSFSMLSPNLTRGGGEYKVYVKKDDYDYALYLIREI